MALKTTRREKKARPAGRPPPLCGLFVAILLEPRCIVVVRRASPLLLAVEHHHELERVGQHEAEPPLTRVHRRAAARDRVAVAREHGAARALVVEFDLDRTPYHHRRSNEWR